MAKTKWPEHVLATDDARGLRDIHKPEFNLAVWQRSPDSLDPDLLDCIKTMPADLPEKELFLLYGRPSDVAYDAKLFASRMPWLEPLIKDVAKVNRIFSRLAKPRYINSRFLSMSQGAHDEYEFHVDGFDYGLSMLVIYRGPGMECLGNCCAKRGPSPYQLDFNSCWPRHLFSIPRFYVVVIKQVSYPGARFKAAIHRPPSMRGQKKSRLRFIAIGEK